MNTPTIKKTNTRQGTCAVCKRKFPLKSLVKDMKGLICVDCVVEIEMSTLEAEIEASKVLDD